MRQNTLGGLTVGLTGGLTGGLAPSAGQRQQTEADRYAHGGNVHKLAERAGVRSGELVDFSASINPLGPPTWLAEEIASSLAEVVHYPDPEAADLTLAACERYKVWPTQALAGNGASELLPAVCNLAARMGHKRAIIPVPAYVDVDRCCRLAGLNVETLTWSAWPGCCPRPPPRQWSCSPAPTTPRAWSSPRATCATWPRPSRTACSWWTRASPISCRA
jgi:hypothetical protein